MTGMSKNNWLGRLGTAGPSRRNFLRGAGVCLALPWLEGLLPKQASGQLVTAPLRFMPIFFPNGASSYWTLGAAGSGDAWKLSSVLEPFAPLKSKMIAFSNLENYSSMAPDLNVEPSHARCSGAFLTCADSDSIRDELDVPVANGISIDQVLAQLSPRETTFDSLQLGLSTQESFCDGRDCSLSQSISWKGPTDPLYKEVNPQVAFDRLVASLTGGGEADAEALAAMERRRALDQSVLNAVLENAKYTRQRLGVEDRRRLDQFMESVHELELQVNAVGGAMSANCVQPARPGSPAQYGLSNGLDGYDRGAHAAAMNEVILMALRCDSTRIISYMLDDARSDFAYNHLDQREFTADGSTPGNGQVAGFHGLQHAGESNNGYSTINYWLNQQVSDLCQKMDAIEEGDRTLLDNTVVFFGSGMHGGNHDPNELPIVLLGSGGGRLKMDQHVAFPATPGDRPLRDLFYTLLNDVYQKDEASFGSHVGGKANSVIDEILV